MGVEFDRILEGFEGPFEEIDAVAKPLTGRVTGARGAAGFLLSHAANDAFTATNRLLEKGQEVYWLSESTSANGTTWPPGTIYIPAASATAGALAAMATELGLSFDGVSTTPSSSALKIGPVRIGLWDRYGGSTASGWTRWLFEQFEFPYQLVFPKDLDAGNLNDKFDVLVFVSNAIPPGGVNMAPRASTREGTQPNAEDIPAEYRGGSDTSPPRRRSRSLRSFSRRAARSSIGSSTNLGPHLGLPMGNHLVDRNGNFKNRPVDLQKLRPQDARRLVHHRAQRHPPDLEPSPKPQ